MNTSTRVAAFAAGLAAVFAGAAGIGTLTGPVGTAGPGTAAPAGHGAGHDQTGTSTGTEQASGHLPGGLMVSQDGYTLDLASRQLPAADDAPLQFRVLGPDGAPVTRYSTEHGKDLHLIVVRRDLDHFQHLHPHLGPAGTWTVPVDVSDPGVYRVFADFTPAGRTGGLTLGSDLSVGGDYAPQPLPAPGRTAEVDGYAVSLDGTLTPGQESELTLSVSRDGQPVTDLQPYLEAYGHLVALRDRDLAHLHVHPAGSPGDGTTEAGPGITFFVTAPTAGIYRLFLDFQHDDEVRTAAFTVAAGDAAAQGEPSHPDPAASAPPTEDAPGHGHGG
jgi:hypothetical protein